jgi:hypothetical protein
MANVVPIASATAFKKAKTVHTDDGEVNFANVYELTKFVAAEIRASKMKFTKLADKAGCCPATVSNLAHGVTRDPRTGTMLNILRVLGFRVIVRR